MDASMVSLNPIWPGQDEMKRAAAAAAIAFVQDGTPRRDRFDGGYFIDELRDQRPHRWRRG
jgi:hypothetical protein